MDTLTIFSGKFSYIQKDKEKSSIDATIKTNSTDLNQVKRDKHLGSDGFLSVDKFLQADFVSSNHIHGINNSGILKGKLTLHGMT